MVAGECHSSCFVCKKGFWNQLQSRLTGNPLGGADFPWAGLAFRVARNIQLRKSCRWRRSSRRASEIVAQRRRDRRWRRNGGVDITAEPYAHEYARAKKDFAPPWVYVLRFQRKISVTEKDLFRIRQGVPSLFDVAISICMAEGAIFN
jgi:hypothetical protein